MSDRLRRGLPALIGLVLFVLALGVLHRELQTVTWHEVTRDVSATPAWRLTLALLITIVNYAALTGYDFLALASIQKRLPWHRIAFTSLIAYAVANTVGFAMLSGASVRYRFYTRWGVTGEDLSRVVFSYVVTFWLGLLLLGGLSLAIGHVSTALDLPGSALAAPIGWLLVLASFAYVALTFVRRPPLRLRPLARLLPAPRIAVAQLGISVLDWALAAAVLFAILPASRLSFLGFVGAFMAAQLLGLASHVPGGVGVFEGVMVMLLKPFLASGVLVPALVVYRAVYYLMPLAGALIALVADELHQRRAQAARITAIVGRMTQQLTPRVLAVVTFLSGVVLLFSGATPAAAGRLRMLERILPLGVIEVSHFIGSIAGAALLLLSQGLARRLDAAYLLTALAMAFGIGASVLKGGDYEAATALTVLLLVLWRARPAFDRRAAFFETRFSMEWAFAIAGAMIASIWLELFAFKHVEYSHELWWQFELRAEASRVLRASTGAAVFLLLFAFGRLIALAPHEAATPTDDELETASAILARQHSTHPYLVFLRDKAVLFDERKTGFVMYGVQGRTWVALGDPVGPPDRHAELIRLFLERCDDFGGVPVFYEVSKDGLHRYADFGLAFAKLGEEARVDLTRFALDGGEARKHRQGLRHLEKEGATFRIAPSDEVPGLMAQLRSVSDEWLGKRAGAEKGFSLGFFNPEYLSRFPMALIERGGRVVAFANMWPGPEHAELSADLMRYGHDAPRDVMDALFVHLMIWGKAQGYEWFSLGMAPLAGFEHSPVARLWNRLGSFVYRHGEALYNFQGLRVFKNKFHPAWEPRYLAYPGALRLPHILADVAALIAGGYRRILLK